MSAETLASRLADAAQGGGRIVFVDARERELVISHGATGYIALYRHDARHDVVRILRIRHQREAGYRD